MKRTCTTSSFGSNGDGNLQFSNVCFSHAKTLGWKLDSIVLLASLVWWHPIELYPIAYPMVMGRSWYHLGPFIVSIELLSIDQSMVFFPFWTLIIYCLPNLALTQKISFLNYLSEVLPVVTDTLFIFFLRVYWNPFMKL